MSINEALLDAFDDIKDQLIGENIKWVEEHNMHLTLKFIGDTEEKQIGRIIASLQEIISASNSFSLHLNGIGFFGKSTSPKVIWAGINKEPQLLELQQNIENSLMQLGIAKESRPFNPHLTLGRIKFIKDLIGFQKCMQIHKNEGFESIIVDEFVLFESKLTPSGPIYKPLARFPLR